MIRVGIVAPMVAVRAGLRTLLETDSNEFLQVVFETPRLADAEAIPPETDVLILSGETAPVDELRMSLLHRQGQLAILLLSDDPQATQGLRNLPLRAWGVLANDATPEELVAAVQALHAGLLVGTPSLMNALMLHYISVSAEEAGSLTEQLTERESEVLQLLALGLANKQIAQQLSISEHTVKFHVSSIYAKLGATSRTEAVRLGVQRGWVVL
jgi:DNA-binding NarL/FixJ family response regulator